MDATQADGARFCVVVNDEDQYAFWPADRDPPQGWHLTGAVGDIDECAAYVSEVWTDMRPRSVRAAMATAEHENSGQPTDDAPPP